MIQGGYVSETPSKRQTYRGKNKTPLLMEKENLTMQRVISRVLVTGTLVCDSDPTK